MSQFSDLWDHEVKQLADACTPERRWIELCLKGDNYQPTDEEKQYVTELDKKYKDLWGQFYISQMAWRIEHGLMDQGRTLPAAMISIEEVLETLTSDSYFQNVFKGNAEDEEWKTRAALRDGLKKLKFASTT